MSAGRLTAGLLAVFLLGAGSAQADVLLGSGGIPGRSSVSEPARCKYSRTAGPNAWLEVAMAPPVAVGAHRIGSYQFFNQFNVGPLGPFGHCANYIAP